MAHPPILAMYYMFEKHNTSTFKWVFRKLKPTGLIRNFQSCKNVLKRVFKYFSSLIVYMIAIFKFKIINYSILAFIVAPKDRIWSNIKQILSEKSWQILAYFHYGRRDVTKSLILLYHQNRSSILSHLDLMNGGKSSQTRKHGFRLLYNVL